MAIEITHVPNLEWDGLDPDKAKLNGTLAIKASPAYSPSLTRPVYSPPPKLYDTKLVATYEVETTEGNSKIEFWSCHALFDMGGEHFDRMDYFHFVSEGDIKPECWSLYGDFWIVFPEAEVTNIKEVTDA